MQREREGQRARPEAMEAQGKAKVHVVMVPFLAQGHIIPFVELSKRLSREGVRISLVTTPRNAERVRAQIERKDNDDDDDDDDDGENEAERVDEYMENVRVVALELPTMDGLPVGLENSENVAAQHVDLLLCSWGALSHAFDKWLAHQVEQNNDDDDDWARPVCVVTCMFGDWVHDSAAKAGLPTVVFHTTGLFGTALLHAVANHDPHREIASLTDEFLIPGLLTFEARMRKCDLPLHLREQRSNPRHEAIKALMNKSMQGHMFLFNSAQELEPEAAQHFGISAGGRPVMCVGPLLPSRARRKPRGKASDIAEEELLRWLGARAERSVLFVCLGSQFLMTPAQSRALAQGLEQSGQPFVWAIRSVDSGGALPEGFEERTRDRGLLIWGWAPQLLILGHPAVGAFLTHTGWNSTLECLTVAGVPMLTWPMYADQPFNNYLLVHRLRVAVNVCVDVAAVPDPAVVSDAARTVLVSDDGAAMRARAQQLSAKAVAAAGAGGSSELNLKRFLHHLHLLSTSSSSTTMSMSMSVIETQKLQQPDGPAAAPPEFALVSAKRESVSPA